MSKRKLSPYRSGPGRDWRKIKTAGWREANRERWCLFVKGLTIPPSLLARADEVIELSLQLAQREKVWALQQLRQLSAI